MADSQSTCSSTRPQTLLTVLEAHGLTPCFFLQFACTTHGAVRMAVRASPAERQKCPFCRAMCEYTLIGRGGTRRPLPFYDIGEDHA